MYDKHWDGHHDCDHHHHNDCDHHGHHDCWGPHGPDGPCAPLYRWPDIYHPVPYGEEWRGNQPLKLGGCHPCPPRDWARHDCKPDPYYFGHPDNCCPNPNMPIPDNCGCDDNCGCGKHECFTPVAPFCVPHKLYNLFDDYIDLLHKYCTLDNCTDQCNCINDLEKVRAKIRVLLKDIEHAVNNLGGEYNRLQKQVCYYMGKTNAAIEMAEECLHSVDEVEKQLDAIADEFEEIRNEFKSLSTVYPVVYNLNNGTYERVTSDADVRVALDNDKALIGIILENGEFARQVYCTGYTVTENSFTLNWELLFTDGENVLYTFKGVDNGTITFTLAEIQTGGGDSAPEATAETIEDVLGGMD